VGRALLAGLLLLPIGAMPGLAQDSDASPPASLGSDGSVPGGADVIQQCERLLAAADAGDGAASTQFGELYESVHLRALYEATFDPMDKYATPIAPEIDDWLLQRANGGSAAAQYWMAARGTLKNRPNPADPAEAARWYRLSAEQGFPPAELALGQILIFFPSSHENRTSQSSGSIGQRCISRSGLTFIS
jgi:hypothetical protein